VVAILHYLNWQIYNCLLLSVCDVTHMMVMVVVLLEQTLELEYTIHGKTVTPSYLYAVK